MDYRVPHGAAQRPRVPQRAVSGGASYGSFLPKRPTLPTRLSSVRSVSQPSDVVDLTTDGVGDEKNAAAFTENREKMVKSPDVITLDDDEVEPPAKRVKIEREGPGSDGTNAGETNKTDEVTPGSPLPSLPLSKPVTRRGAVPRRSRFGIEPAARKAHGIDPPAAATRVLPPKKTLDFSPWAGNHNEDVLTETVIKAGYFDKPPGTNQVESNSAKASIWPNLSQRNHHGLSMLGYLFTAVIEKRQAIGRCTAPSTFKPPPRVTVTDTKREAWLRGLADPEVPLRKQSRTIPHGIRGKLLMEQCLSKEIPLQRAVWLAKCVGANELRAFRRKGVSGSSAATGEAKWVREWTVHVEQFLEGVVSACGQQGWQKNINYAVRLATAFYTEKMLDSDHYLDWLVSSLAEATLERLPLWVVMAQIYWKDILIYSKRGRQLAEGILEHLHNLTIANMDVNTPLKARLQKLVTVLAVSSRGCLILPHLWEKYKDLLNSSPGSDVIAETAASNTARRNEILAAPLSKTAANNRSPLHDLYRELDSCGIHVDIEKLAQKCIDIVPDTFQLVSTLLDWASTLYRTGNARVYLASGVIGKLHAAGHDTNAAVLRCLAEWTSMPAACANSIHIVIGDLVRHDSFSVGRYLQWLITSGTMSSSKERACATGLIAALPTSGLPLHVLNTRKTLMKRLGYAVDETPMVANVLAKIEDAMARSVKHHIDSIVLPEDLTMSAKLSISQRLCKRMTSMAKHSTISLGAFTVARDVLERIGDVLSLSLMVSDAMSTDINSLLATITDTITMHAAPLAALGRLKPLVDTITERYLTLRSQQPSERSSILALSGLIRVSKDDAAFLKLLGDDLAICEQQYSLAVCSPASDSLIGMQAATLDSDDDIDAVFASGNTMDEKLMQRVFMRIMQRAVKPVLPGPEYISQVGSWLNQLRAVDGSSALDKLVKNYLRTLLKSSTDGNFFPNALEYLIASDSVSLVTIADIVMEVESPRAAISWFHLFNQVISTGLHACEKYRLVLQQTRFRVEYADALISLVRTACDSPDLTTEDPNLLDFIIQTSIAQSDSLCNVFHKGVQSDTLIANGGRIATAIVNRERPMDQQPSKLDIRSLVKMSQPFSVRYTVGLIHYINGVSKWTSDDDNILAAAILESFSSSSEVWPQLLEHAGEAVNRSLHEWAREQVLRMATVTYVAEDTAIQQHLERCLHLLAVTNGAAHQSDSASFVGTITDKLKGIEGQLLDLTSAEKDSDPEFETCLHQLRSLLHLCVMHVHQVLNESEISKQVRCGLLATLCSLLVQKRLQIRQDLMDYLLDLASTLANNLQDTSLAQLKMQDRSKFPPDHRLAFIFGTHSDSTDTWLALASGVHLPGSQQQRVLSRQPSQQQLQTSGRPQAPGQPLQSPTTLQQHQRWPSSGHVGAQRQDNRMPVETKLTPYPLRRWEIMPDPTPVMGENDASLSLGLFGARKV